MKYYTRFCFFLFVFLMFKQICVQAQEKLNKQDSGIKRYQISYEDPYNIPDESANVKNVNVIDIVPQYNPPKNAVGVSTNISGYYDYQSNGGEIKYIEMNPTDPNKIHAIMMVATDRNNISTSRRTRYSYSSNGGSTWMTSPVFVPSIRSGFPSMALNPFRGIPGYPAVIANHAAPAGYTASYLYFDAGEGAGNFSQGFTPDPIDPFYLNDEPIWPQVAVASNGNTVIAASRQLSKELYVVIFDVNGLFSNWYPIDITNASGGRYAIAIGPPGRVAIAWHRIWANILTDTVFYVESTNNGQTWSAPQVAAAAHPSTKAIYWGGIDAIYLGNTLYIAYTAIPVATDGNLYYESNRIELFNATTMTTHVVIDSNNFPLLMRSLPNDSSQLNHAWSFTYPSLGRNQTGTRLYLACDAFRDSVFENTPSGGWHYSDIIYTYSDDGGNTWASVRNIARTRNLDERYVSVSTVNPVINDSNWLYVVFQEDSIPGSAAFGDGRPVSLATLKFLKVNTDRPIPDPFLLTSPQNGQMNCRVNDTLRWQASNYASEYEVYLGSSFPLRYIGTVTTNFYNYSGLEYSKIYYWNIFAINNDGERMALNGPFYFKTKNYPANVMVNKRWNILSVPVKVDTYYFRSIFPNATSSPLTFSNGYIIQDTLKGGIGYWVKFEENQNILIEGKKVTKDTFNVSPGWNMIGSISYPVALNNIITHPSSIISSYMYGYESRYTISDTIKPGKGYWIKVNQAGKLYLSTTNKFIKNNLPERNLEKFSILKFKDSNDDEQMLYYGKQPDDGFDVNFYEMPPLPPSGVFDVRYSTNRMVEVVGENESNEYQIKISSENYPVTISWEVKDIEVVGTLKVGNKEITLRGNGSVKITEPEVKVCLSVNGVADIPREYSLLQNYPNPFNPTTVIKYQLPEQSRVSLKIYNIIGQEVATMVDDIQDAGYKVVEWNIESVDVLSSGVYYYRIVATPLNGSNSFIQTRKMLLLK